MDQLSIRKFIRSRGWWKGWLNLSPSVQGRKVQSPLWWNWRNDPLVAADRCEIKGRRKEIKGGSVVSRGGRGSFIWIRAGLWKKKKCNRMVTVHTQTRRKGIKLGLTFETRWNVIQEIRFLSPSQIELNLSSFRSGYSFSFSLFLI